MLMARRISLIAGALMGCVFFGMGLALLLTRDFIPEAQPPYRSYAAWVLLIWGGFRIILTWLRFKAIQQQTQHDEI
jgi:ABC-type Mn2+/Zn2+ transport system permease subunit